MRSRGFAEDHITLTPHRVDNDWWAAQSAKVDRAPELSWFSRVTDRCDKPCIKGLSTWESLIAFASWVS
jgi:hypothetical protein